MEPRSQTTGLQKFEVRQEWLITKGIDINNVLRNW